MASWAMLARMLPRVKMPIWALLIGLIIGIAGWPRLGLGDDTLRDLKTGWALSLGISSSAVVQRVQASIGTGNIYCPGPPICAFVPHENPIQPGAPKTERERTFTPALSATFELMSPSLIDGLGAPRPFAHVDQAYTFGFDRDITVLGAPGPITFPPNPPFPNPVEELIQGQGSNASFDPNSFQFSGGLGIAFTFEVADRTLRLKPSFEYMREDIEFNGEVVRMITSRKAETGVPALYRTIRLTGSDRETYHSIGPGLEVEIDTRRAGPLMLSLFAGARAYAIVGDLEVQFEDTNEYGENAVWSFLPNRWLFMGNVGLRFRWVSE